MPGKRSSTETSSRSRSASAALITFSSATRDRLRPIFGRSSQHLGSHRQPVSHLVYCEGCRPILGSLAAAEGLVNRFNAELRRMVADRTYHRLLHVDWIRADVDGERRQELVSRTDQAGPKPPERSYDLFVTTPEPAPVPRAGDPRFYFGGSIYENWASVPEHYKTSNSDMPDSSRSTASIFRFTW